MHFALSPQKAVSSKAASVRLDFIASGAMRKSCARFAGKSLAKLRREVEPVEQHTLARFLTHWQGLLVPRRSGPAHLDALLDAIENLQGAPIPASLLETSILPARVSGYDPAGLDTLVAAGEIVVVWRRAHRRT